MSIWSSIGITSYQPGDLVPDDLEGLAAWRDLGRTRPLLIRPDKIGELASFLLDRAEPGPMSDRRFVMLRQTLFAAARAYRTTDGRELVALDDATESSVRRRLDELARDDGRALLSLGMPLALAEHAVGEDGAVTGDRARALETWGRAADAVEALASRPRLARRLGLDDMLRGIDGTHALVAILELYRRLLLAAGRAIDDLSAATIGHHDFRDVDDAVATWRISQGDAARRIGVALDGLASRTPGLDDAPADLPAGASYDGSWILPFSRLGQRVMAWALGLERPTLDLAGVGAAWPGPALYGYDDYEEEPRAAHALLSELARDDGGPTGLLLGSSEATVLDDLSVAVPGHLLEGDRRAYVTRRSDEFGSYLGCVGESRRAGILARLITDEQQLVGPAWDLPGDEAAPGDAFPATFDEEFDRLSIEGDLIDLDERGRLPLDEVAFDGRAPGATLVICGDGEELRIAERDQETRRLAHAGDWDPMTTFFVD